MSASDHPPATLEERLKRALVPPRLELARITRRELKKGEPELRLLPHLLDRSRAAMDIGANRGIWAGLMARHCGTVWAFEPNPKLFAVLERAAAPNVECRRIALSDAAGEAMLMIPGEAGRYSNQGASLSRDKIGTRAHMSVSVDAARLDDLDPPPTGFLKIDVEGHERAVIEGARGLIARDRPVMIVEMEERHTGREISGELDFVEALGYRTLVLKEGQLSARSRFDPDADHRARAGKPGYINNFIFLPE
ncbi:FkbM family methyltransferase [Marinicauda algicola]|uniref:FkbM family methyltransferase n=1 Tax=Marinicauda algicola TaxID=2029849 RepID=A0A4S2GZU2_9PROT|nr:FkbM family methyltransferase [Marinicauda algicola]TGY88352.1 FkbM family methyltransferase [Marinicauda algicola]